MDLRLTRAPAERGGGGARRRCLHAGAGGRRGGRRADRSLGGGGARRATAVRLGAASARSWRVAARSASAGVCERAESGGGEPRAARARADGRARSAPPLRAPPAPRRARSLPGTRATPPLPRLRPVFLWARQHDGTVQEVRCEDYDSRNRIRIARTPNGWRVIPRTEIYNSIRVPPAPPRERRERRRRRRYGKCKRRRAERPPSAWLAPDLESHIPSHTIAVPRGGSPRAPDAGAAPEPTALDNLLAVAELEFHQQRGSDLLELDASAAQYSFLPEEEVARDVMSFELGEPKPPDDLFYDGKAHQHPPVERPEETSFANDMSAHKDLFETISEAHYLPELGGPHDEALLESLVEKGCEDNQILGQALDKLAHLVHSSGDYAEEEDDMLLGGAPVADIIDRLEQSLESPGRSSMTAAQGLLHLHHIADHHPEHAYMADRVFAQQPPVDCPIDALESHPTADRVNHIEYEDSAEKRLAGGVETTDVMYTESVPDTHETYDKSFEEHPPQSLPDQSEVPLACEPCEAPSEIIGAEICENNEIKLEHTQEISEQEALPAVETIEFKEEKSEESPRPAELEPTDLRIKHVESSGPPVVVASAAETTHAGEDNLSEKSDEQPRDLSVPRRASSPHESPRRAELPRAPSRESDAMQSPQPSGIPAVPSSPEIFTMPHTKSKHALYLETLLSSPSPKMYTSEVTITKQQCEPLNLGKHRKSASPTVTSCSDEMKKLHKEFGEPQEKRIRRESADDIVKINKIFSSKDDVTDIKPKKLEKAALKFADETSPLKQFLVLKTSPDFNIPDPLLVPKDKLNLILENPGREIPTLLIQRPELRLPEAFAFPAVLQDPDILVVSLQQLESILENDAKKMDLLTSPKPKESKSAPPTVKTPTGSAQSSTPHSETGSTSGQPKPIPSMDALAGDIDAATSAALNQMLWLPYLSQLEAMAACSQNMDFLKALNSSGYNGPNYPDLSQMFNPAAARFMGQPGFPMVPPMDYDNRLQFAMWQEAMNHANATASQRGKQNLEAQMKELSTKATDVQNPYVHSTKNHQSKAHSAARTSPIAHNYNNNQRSMGHNPFLQGMQGMYPGMGPNIRPNMANMPLPGLQIPYFNPNMMSSRSPRTGQQKSPTSPYYPNNNYLQSVKQSESQGHHQRSSSTSSQESPRPRISVKSLQNLLEPSAAAASGRRAAHPPAAMGRRREEPEVGSTTPGEPPPHHLPPMPHDPASFHLWHPLFGNQKGYASPWSWTTVTATGD